MLDYSYRTTPGAPDWWRRAIVYEVYPRSFADSNGDGLGDLTGVTQKIPYLASLGVDAVWLTPFYPSALADGGYDVDDYRDVAPELGSLDDFDVLTAAAHANGIKIIVDIVPNHTSNRHAWFVEALATNLGSDARNRYIFRDGKGPDGAEPPNDWPSLFGGSAWARVPDGQWYLHLFAPEQPDLNWTRRDVRDDFLHTLRFWADRGVDGFRVDVAFALAKDMSEPFATSNALMALFQRGDADGQHPFFDRDEVHEIYAEWRTVFNSYDPPRTAVAEAFARPHRLTRYASAEGLGQAFNFDLLLAPWLASQFRTIITDHLALAATAGSSTTWVLSNHDVVRHATRYGAQPPAGEPLPTYETQGFALPAIDAASVDRIRGTQRARAAILLLLALPGSTYIYQGEELGLFEVLDIPPERRQDPTFFRTAGTVVGRDGCRVPLPWTTAAPSYGFSTAEAHLPQPAWFAAYAISAEEHDPQSMLNLYRSAIRMRRDLYGSATLSWLDDSAETVHFARSDGWHCLTNFGADPVTVPDGEILISSTNLSNGQLPTDATVWYRPA